jgi:ATP-dependent 26S proteasome regulatory subunit
MVFTLAVRSLQVNPEGKYVVDLDKTIDVATVTPNSRVALRSDSYTLHKVLPNKVDPLVSLMMVEKVPDSTYEMVGGLDKQIKEIKEVCLSLPFFLRTLCSAIARFKSNFDRAELSSRVLVLSCRSLSCQ